MPSAQTAAQRLANCWLKYFAVSTSCGALRTLYYTRDAEVRWRPEKYKDGKQLSSYRPLLVTERVALSALNACSNVLLFPYTLYEDVCLLEAKIRGIETSDTVDVIFLPWYTWRLKPPSAD